MIFEYTITVRSQIGKNSDFGRALERVAFFPGVIHAEVLARDANSITIGYNGRRSPLAKRDFSAELNAESLIAHAPLWDPGSEMSRARYFAMLRRERFSEVEEIALSKFLSPVARTGANGPDQLITLHT